MDLDAVVLTLDETTALSRWGCGAAAAAFSDCSFPAAAYVLVGAAPMCVNEEEEVD